jgi:hypothetical protein
MRRYKQGHAWKWNSNCGHHAVCPFCGVERKLALRGAKGASSEGFRRIGSSEKWSREMPRCARLVSVGRSIRYRGHVVEIMGLSHDWPARFLCYRGGRSVVVPVLAYWRARRARPVLAAAFTARGHGSPVVVGDHGPTESPHHHVNHV